MKKEYDDDDGRVVADMSDVERRSPLDGWFPRKFRKKPSVAEPTEKTEPLKKEERRAYVISALLSALLIGGIFAAGLAIIILIMTIVW